MVKNPPANEGDGGNRVRSLGQEESLEEETATCSSILAWKIPRTEEPGRLQSRVTKESDMAEHTHTHIHTHTSVLLCVVLPFFKLQDFSRLAKFLLGKPHSHCW